LFAIDYTSSFLSVFKCTLNHTIRIVLLMHSLLIRGQFWHMFDAPTSEGDIWTTPDTKRRGRL